MRFLTFLALLGFTLLGEAQATPPTCWPSNIGGTGGEATYSLFNRVGPYAGWHCPDGTDALYAVRQGDVSDELGKALNAASSASDKQSAAAALLPFQTRSLADVFDVWQSVASWKPVVAEGGGVHLSNPTAGAVIRYGADTRWVIKTVYGDIACTNATFGADPAQGARKGCEQAVFIGKAIPVAAPVYTHHVKPNGTVNDRPVYPFANGVKGTAALVVNGVAVRATVNQPCDPSKAQAPSGTSTTDLYAAYAPAFAASAVTLCTRSTP